MRSADQKVHSKAAANVRATPVCLFIGETKSKNRNRNRTKVVLPAPATDVGEEQFPISPDHVLSRHVTCHVSPDWSAHTTVVTPPWRVTRASRDGGSMSAQPTTAADHPRRSR